MLQNMFLWPISSTGVFNKEIINKVLCLIKNKEMLIKVEIELALVTFWGKGQLQLRKY